MTNTSQWKRLLFCVLFCALSFALLACGSSASSSNNELQADFSLSLSSSSLSITAGSSQNLTVSATASNGFSGSISVVLSGLPSTITASPSSVQLSPGSSQSITLTADATAAAASVTVTVTGTSGSLTHATTLMLDISAAPPAEDFTLSSTPGNLALTAGSTGEVLAINATAVNGFSGSVDVSFKGLPAGVTATPSALSLAPGSPQNVTFTAASTAAVGKSSLTIAGVSGSLSHSISVPLNVSAPPPAPDFTLSLSPVNLSLTAGAAGRSIAVTVSAVNGFSGRVDVALAGLPAGVTAAPSVLSLEPGTPQNVTLTAAATAHTGNATVVFTATSGSLTHKANLALSVSAPPPAADFTLTAVPSSLTLTAGAMGQPVTLTVTGGNGFNSPVAVAISGLPAGVSASPAALTLSPGTPQNVTLTAASSAAVGKTTVTFTGSSGSLTHTATVALEVDAALPPPDFSLSVTPQSLTLTTGATGQPVSLSASPANGFNQTVGVAASGLPSGVTASPSTLSLTPGTPENSTLTAASNTSSGNATVTFTGTSGSLSHTANLSLTVNAPGFDVTTYHYDNARDGLNANEKTLTLSNVNSTNFGKIGFYAADGKVNAEPLYLSAFPIKGGTHNVLYVASEHDSVYAFDADTGSILWQVSVLASGETTSDDHGCGQISPEIGITSTPGIDRNLGAIFVVAMSKDKNGAYHQRLHALNLATGAEMEGGPTEITASFPGNGYGSENGVQTFDPGQYAQRAGLLLMHGSILMGWSSHCDGDPYTGWLMMYNAATLQQTSVLNLTPNGPSSPHYNNGEGSIWQSGAGLAGDAQGNVYFLDANGTFDTTLDANGFPSQGDFGNAFMKVSTAGNKLTAADYFNTYNTVSQSTSDLDLGSGGVLLLPDVTDSNGATRYLAVGAGKDGNIYVVDRTNMGKFNASANNIYQQLSHVLSGEFGMAAYFNGTVYYGSVGSTLQAFPVQSGKLATSSSSRTAVSFTYPGTTPGISANGTQNGIVWAVENSSPAVLRAYDASNLATELYNSSQAPNSRDNFGNGNKFITPMIVDGKVFVGTATGVAVFGLLN